MKLTGCLATLLLALLLDGGAFASTGLTTVQVLNRDYAHLNDWARLRGFKTYRHPTSREVLVTNATTRIALRIDSSRIEFNKVALWLSFPVLLTENQVVVSEKDLVGVLDALVQPRRMATGKTVRTVCLDPGHGGKEPGQKAGTRLEKTFTLDLAREVRTLLANQGYKVIMTRLNDSYVDHPQRTALAKRAGADLFVSLHYNAAPNAGSDANGVEVYAMTPEGARSTNTSTDAGPLRAWAGNKTDSQNVLLAYHLQRSLLNRLPGTADRGVRRARFLVLRLSEMPAVLIEGGFMSNAADARWIYSATGRKKMAQAIVDGINGYKRQVEASPLPTPQRNTSSKSSSKTTRPASAKN